jgi:hypothetical protein
MSSKFSMLSAVAVCLSLASPACSEKQGSALFPQDLVAIARRNCETHGWARSALEQAVNDAKPFRDLSDDRLWSLMFGNTLPRSWMVWSDGHCPSCQEPVPMYNWKIQAMARPWKVECPHCAEVFPKNDFKAYYDSGLDVHRVFDRGLADLSLLFNSDHPDPNDPLRGYGVDDGLGYKQGEHTWRFIATYLIYGQWKQAVLGGIRSLADAYTLTGDPVYARKAAILLDRVADLHPTFDFKEQGVLYEGPGSAGYLSTWHDSCEETREMAIAYDQIYAGMEGDPGLVRFLSSKAEEHGLENRKASVEDIRSNIENRILKDALDHPDKIYSNYPRREIAQIVIRTVLGWPGNREEVMELMDGMLEQATAVDGITGEKGLANYSAFVIQSLAAFLETFRRMDPAFLADLIERNPRLSETWRFHIDTWCLEKYYPYSGDTGWIGKVQDTYVGVLFQPAASLQPSMYSFLDALSTATGDPAYTQALFLANGTRTAGLPYDLFVQEPEDFQKRVENLIAKEGSLPRVDSIDKREWHLAILRSGSGENRRALWIDYDSGGGHSHRDGLNLGLVAKGLDLLPDFGYPPVQFQGWGGEKSSWYTSTPAHNTVTVDGKNHANAAGRTAFWAVGEQARAIRCEAPELVEGNALRRTLAMVDFDAEDSYLVDVLHVSGGTSHTRHLHSFFGELRVSGLNLEATEEARGSVQRFTQVAQDPDPGWEADWRIEDRYSVLPAETPVGLRVIDFTPNATVLLGESWVVPGGYSSTEEAWIPQIDVRRDSTGGEPLNSEFVCLIEPYGAESKIASARRLESAEDVTLIEVKHRSGAVDAVVIPRDIDGSKRTRLPELGIVTESVPRIYRKMEEGEWKALEWKVE